MNVLCVYFPRLPVQAALQNRPHLAGQELVLVTGAGDDALITAMTPGPARDGVVAGMRAADARRLSPRAAFVPGGAFLSLRILEPAAALVRGRVTPFVEIGGAEYLYAGIPTEPGDVRLLAGSVKALVASWTGLAVRVGAGPSRAAALAAARCARDGVGVESLPDTVIEPPIAPWRADDLDATVSLVTPGDARNVARRFAQVLNARGEGWRTLHVASAGGLQAAWRSVEPVYDAAALEERLRDAIASGVCGEHTQVTAGGLVPDFRVKPYLGGGRSERPAPARVGALAHTFPRPLRAAS